MPIWVQKIQGEYFGEYNSFRTPLRQVPPPALLPSPAKPKTLPKGLEEQVARGLWKDSLQNAFQYVLSGDLSSYLEQRGEFEKYLDQMVRAAGQLKVPPSTREALTQSLHAHCFYQVLSALKREVKQQMLRAPLDPKDIIQWDGKKLSYHHARGWNDLQFLFDYGRRAGLSAEQVHGEIEGMQREFQKIDGLMVTGDLLVGAANYYGYLLPERACPLMEELPAVKCRSWKERLQPRHWVEDFYQPVENGIRRFLHAF